MLVLRNSLVMIIPVHVTVKCEGVSPEVKFLSLGATMFLFHITVFF